MDVQGASADRKEGHREGEEESGSHQATGGEVGAVCGDHAEISAEPRPVRLHARQRVFQLVDHPLSARRLNAGLDGDLGAEDDARVPQAPETRCLES